MDSRAKANKVTDKLETSVISWYARSAAGLLVNIKFHLFFKILFEALDLALKCYILFIIKVNYI